MWIKSNDCESFIAARSLIKDEGLLVGGSSGANLSSALKLAKSLPEDKRVVVLLPDGIRNYMTKFISDYWMESRGFLVRIRRSNLGKIYVSEIIFFSLLRSEFLLQIPRSCKT